MITRHIQDVVALVEVGEGSCDAVSNMLTALDRRLEGLRKKALKAKTADTERDLRVALDEIADELWEIIS